MKILRLKGKKVLLFFKGKLNTFQTKRNFLYFTIALVIFSLFLTWTFKMLQVWIM